MKTLHTIHHKKDETFDVNSFENAQCTIPFDFKGKEHLYIELKYGDCTPIFALSNKLWGLGIKATIFTPIWYLGFYDGISPQTPVITLSDVLCNDELQNVNLSKYIPKDNAVLFLSKEDRNQYDYNDNLKFRIVCQDSIIPDSWKLLADKSSEITIFLPHGTQSELQKVEEVGKYLWENFGIKPNLCALHWFDRKYCFDNEFHIKQIKEQIEYHKQEIRYNMMRQGVAKEDLQRSIKYLKEQLKYFENSPFNKIITTNSTGILKPEDSSERFQVIDAKEIFEEYLKENNL